MPDGAPVDLCRVPPPAGLYVGIAEFNCGAYFECHETLEHLWMREPGPIRRLYQGILQVGVGFYHLRNGNYRGTLNLLASATGYLAGFGPVCLGVEVARLSADAAAVHAAVLALGPTALSTFDLATLPRVCYDPQVAATALAEPPPLLDPADPPGHW